MRDQLSRQDQISRRGTEGPTMKDTVYPQLHEIWSLNERNGVPSIKHPLNSLFGLWLILSIISPPPHTHTQTPCRKMCLGLGRYNILRPEFHGTI